jgi:hypothetical protein
MTIDIIIELLKQYRKGISLENLCDLLEKKQINISAEEILSKTNLFKLHNGIVFLKSTLQKVTDDFIKEFDDFMKVKMINKNTRESIISLFVNYIPDELYIEWLEISLDRKLLIFDLLYSMILKPKNLKDKFKIYFNELIEFYSASIVYTLLLSKTYENDYDKFIHIVQKIENYEDLLKSHLFNMLTVPDIVKLRLKFWKDEFRMIKMRLKHLLETQFTGVKKYSEKLYKRVIKNELKKFDLLSLLSRMEYKTFYDWILSITEVNLKPKHNLFEDLGF